MAAASLPFPLGGADHRAHDTSQTAYVVPLVLLKILIHAARESPVPAMGVLLGKELGGFTVRVVDAFPLPCRAVWASDLDMDRGYIDAMLNLLRQTDRVEGVVGWYRSHPGFSCQPSDRDVRFHKCFAELNDRAILVIVNPIKSVKGNFMIHAFRPVTWAPETTSNVGSMNRKFYCEPVIENRFFKQIRPRMPLLFYLILISHRMNNLEVKILKSMTRLGRRDLSDEGLSTLCRFPDTSESDQRNLEEILNDLLIKCQKQVQEEIDEPHKPFSAEKHLEMVENLMRGNILRSFGMMLACSLY